MISKSTRNIIGLTLGLLATGGVLAAGADLGNTTKQATNWVAIAMFAIFVAVTLGITKWAAAKTKSAADFYTAGGGITGFQNGLAIAGDYMSAASFLGISGLVFANGFDGLIFSIGWLVGWPVITFLMAERLRNLGKFTFADVAAYRFAQTPMRSFAATGSLVVVAFYMIAQMVGAGQLIKVLFGMEYIYAVVIVGVLMMCYVLFGGMTATTWVQIIKAIMLLTGATFMALAVLWQFNFNPEALFAKAVEVHPKHLAIMSPGALIKDPVSAISVGMALMFGTAGLPHILMRFFTVPSAKEARKSVGWATTWIGYFYILTFIIGFGAIVMLTQNPEAYYVPKMVDGVQAVGADGKLVWDGLKGGGNMAGMVSIKDVVHVMLSPVDRRRALLRPAVQRVRGAVFAGAVFAGAVFADPGARDGTGWTVCAWARRLGKKPTSSSGMNSRRIATHGIAKQPRGAGSESQDP